MRKYIAGRVAVSILTLLAILLILFLMLQFMPGSPFNDEKLSETQLELLNRAYGLDKPVLIRFFYYIKNMLTGDFGLSYAISKNTPVSSLLAARFPVSARIGGQAVLLGTAVGLLLGVIAAVHHNTVIDTLATVLSVIGISLPSYVFALALAYTFGFRLRWFPLLYQQQAAFLSSILPTISLSMFTAAIIARFTRSEMLDVLNSDYMLAAESKGISRGRLIFVHGLRNALIPIITVLAPIMAGLMTGSLVVEKIFSIPGIGSLLVTAIQSNDYNVIVTLAFLYSAVYIGLMLAVDILYVLIDPRIRLSKEENNE